MIVSTYLNLRRYSSGEERLGCLPYVYDHRMTELKGLNVHHDVLALAPVCRLSDIGGVELSTLLSLVALRTRMDHGAVP